MCYCLFVKSKKKRKKERKKKVKFREIKNRKVVARGWGVGELGIRW